MLSMFFVLSALPVHTMQQKFYHQKHAVQPPRTGSGCKLKEKPAAPHHAQRRARFFAKARARMQQEKFFDQASAACVLVLMLTFMVQDGIEHIVNPQGVRFYQYAPKNASSKDTREFMVCRRDLNTCMHVRLQKK
ncbi:MAG: hypothetical protein UU47_C0012G0008 [candidate division TM6 bacterium GW2011_GWE2_41_16]|nr:MAG: hypothetical protein UU47_C0012G0008 [candidate division TM6 bacterium GW2011_GWE2_41_16]